MKISERGETYDGEKYIEVKETLINEIKETVEKEWILPSAESIRSIGTGKVVPFRAFKKAFWSASCYRSHPYLEAMEEYPSIKESVNINSVEICMCCGWAVVIHEVVGFISWEYKKLHEEELKQKALYSRTRYGAAVIIYHTEKTDLFIGVVHAWPCGEAMFKWALMGNEIERSILLKHSTKEDVLEMVSRQAPVTTETIKNIMSWFLRINP